jgi:hypothetical protein
VAVGWEECRKRPHDGEVAQQKGMWRTGLRDVECYYSRLLSWLWMQFSYQVSEEAALSV